jgi:hypothetical protein
MMWEALILIVLLLVGVLTVGSDEAEADRAEADRLEALNRESWNVLRAARQIHDEAAAALQEMFDTARERTSETPRREVKE